MLLQVLCQLRITKHMRQHCTECICLPAPNPHFGVLRHQPGNSHLPEMIQEILMHCCNTINVLFVVQIMYFQSYPAVSHKLRFIWVLETTQEMFYSGNTLLTLALSKTKWDQGVVTVAVPFWKTDLSPCTYSCDLIIKL